MNEETILVQHDAPSDASLATPDAHVLTSESPAFTTLDGVPLTKHFQKTHYQRVQLIYPSFFLETGKGRKETHLAAILPPLGMLYLAAQIEKAGYTVNVIDAEAERLDDEKTLEHIRTFKPDLVGLYCTTFNFKRLIHLAERIKNETNCTIFFGGPHPTQHWQEVAEQDVVDITFIGEAEETAPEVLEVLKKEGIGLHHIAGIGFRHNDKLIKTAERPFFKDLDAIAFPAFHLVDLKKYKPSPQHVLRLPSVTMVTTRGCPFKCTFCHVPVLFKDTYRQRSVPNVIAEIKDLQTKYGIKEIQFMDDLFGANKRWLEAFVDTIIAEKIDITWSCLTRIDTLHKDLTVKMRKAGCWCIFFGMESLDNDILRAINKKLTVVQIESAIDACKKAGIEIRANFILGSPNETPNIAKRMIQRICALNPDYVKFNVMTPYPGNPIYTQVKQGLWGTMINEDYENMTNHEVIFVPYGYKDAEEVQQMRRYAFRKFYLRPRYVFSRLRKLHSWHDIKRHARGLKLIVSRYVF